MCWEIISAPLVDQSLGGIGLPARVKPGIDPDDLELEIRIYRPRAEHECIDPANNFRDRKRGDVAGNTGLRYLGRDLPDDVTSLVKTR